MIKIRELNIKANITGGNATEARADAQPKAEEKISARGILQEFYDSQPTQTTER